MPASRPAARSSAPARAGRSSGAAMVMSSASSAGPRMSSVAGGGRSSPLRITATIPHMAGTFSLAREPAWTHGATAPKDGRGGRVCNEMDW